VEEMARGEMLHDDLPLERRPVIAEQRLNSLLTLSLFLSLLPSVIIEHQRSLFITRHQCNKTQST
jgi:hypothetical protein